MSPGIGIVLSPGLSVNSWSRVQGRAGILQTLCGWKGTLQVVGFNETRSLLADHGTANENRAFISPHQSRSPPTGDKDIQPLLLRSTNFGNSHLRHAE